LGCCYHGVIQKMNDRILVLLVASPVTCYRQMAAIQLLQNQTRMPVCQGWPKFWIQ
jgi:hypothetical protein